MLPLLTSLISNTWIKLGSIGLLCLLSFFMAWSWRGSIESEHLLKTQTEALVAQHALQTKYDLAAQDYETVKAGMEQEHARVLGELADELSKKPVYHSCVLPSSGLSIVNRALSGTQTPR